MARLSDSDVNRLVTSLSFETNHQSGARLLVPRESSVSSLPGLDARRIQMAQLRLRELSADGTLGPLLTQRLAAYLNRPVRCASGDANAPETVNSNRPADGNGLDDAVYNAQAAGVRYWLRIDAVLAGAIADAVIGGGGDASKVGSGSKVFRLAAGAVTELLRGIAAAADLPEPAEAALDRATRRDLTALAAGSLSVGTRTSPWSAGFLALDVAATPTSVRVARDSGAPLLSLDPVLSSPAIPPREKSGGLDDALESARVRIEQLVRQAVTFDAVKTERLASASIPVGWLRMSLAMRAGGVAIIAVDRAGAAALVNCALAADLVDSESVGALAQTGAEVILMNAIQAFVAALPGPQGELRHTERLTDESILAQLPHLSIEHRIASGRHAGVLRWLIPDSALRPREVALRNVRGGGA